MEEIIFSFLFFFVFSDVWCCNCFFIWFVYCLIGYNFEEVQPLYFDSYRASAWRHHTNRIYPIGYLSGSKLRSAVSSSVSLSHPIACFLLLQYLWKPIISSCVLQSCRQDLRKPACSRWAACRCWVCSAVSNSNWSQNCCLELIN